MNFTQLRAFLAVADKGSFSAAARDQGVSQPAVTLQIQSLEEWLGVELLDRQMRKVRLTESGKAFLPVARQVVAKIENAKRQLQELQEGVRGKLRVGGSTIPGQYVLPKMLGLFHEKYPDVALTLEVADTKAVARAVIERNLDVGLIGARVRGEHLAGKELVDDELVLIAPPQDGSGRDASAGVKPASLDQVIDEDFILREEGSGTRQVIADWLAERGHNLAELSVAMELGSSQAVVSAVEAGLGVSIVSKWAAENALRLNKVALVSLPGLPIKRKLHLVYSDHGQTKATEAFIKFAEAMDIEAIKPDWRSSK